MKDQYDMEIQKIRKGQYDLQIQYTKGQYEIAIQKIPKVSMTLRFRKYKRSL